MSKGAVLVEWRDAVAVITLNRPDRRNAINREMLQLICEAQAEVLLRKARVVVLTGASPAFCAGADLAGVREEEFHLALTEVLHGFTKLPCVVMAAINGPALGAGAQLLAVCDVRMATNTSVIGVPAAKLGLVVHQWTIQRIVREFSWPVARNMLLAASTYTAEQLHQVGVIQRLGELDDALLWAQDIAKLAPLTIAGHKLAFEHSSATEQENELVEQFRVMALASDDAREGREAFLEKRAPRFFGA